MLTGHGPACWGNSLFQIHNAEYGSGMYPGVRYAGKVRSYGRSGSIYNTQTPADYVKAVPDWHHRDDTEGIARRNGPIRSQPH